MKIVLDRLLTLINLKTDIIVDYFKEPIKIFILGFIGSHLLLIVILCLHIDAKNNSNSLHGIIQNRLEDQITIIIGAFSFIALVFSLIQLKKSHDEVVSELFEETYVFQFFGLTSGSIIILIISQLFDSNYSPIYKISVFAQLSLILEVLLLCLMLYRIYSILTTDFFIDKLLEKVYNIVFERNDIALTKLNQNIYNKLLKIHFTAINESDEPITDKSMNLFNEVFEKKLNTDFSYQYYRKFYDEFDISIQQKNFDYSHKLIVIIQRILLKYSKNKNVNVLEYFRDFPKFLLKQILNSTDKKTEIAQSLILRLFEIVKYSIISKDTDYPTYKEKEVFRQLNLKMLYMINECLVILIEKKEVRLWEYSLNEFDQLKEHYKRIADKNPNLSENVNNLLNDVKLIKIGLFSWCFENFLSGIFDVNEFRNFIKYLNLRITKLDELVEFCIFSIEYEFKETKFGWESWDIEKQKRLSYKFEYYKPVSNWIISGLFLIIFDNLYILENQINFIENVINKKEFRFIGNSVSNVIINLQKQYSAKLLEITNITLEELIEKLNKFSNFFISLSKSYDENLIREIVKAPLSEKKVEEFKNSMYKQWKENQLIEKIFNDLTEIEVSNGTNNLHCPCQNHLLTTGKKMFIEVNFELFYGIHFGALVSQKIDTEFINKVISKDSILSNSLNLITTLNQEVEDLKKNLYKPDLIILDSMLFYERMKGIEMLINTQAKIDFNNNYQVYDYNGIHLIPIHYELIKNKVIVSDFQSSFKMLQHRNPEWYDNILKIEITEVTKDEAKEKFIKDKEKMTIIEIESLDEELEIYRRMNDIKIHICEYVDFEIKDMNAFKVIEFRNEDLLN